MDRFFSLVWRANALVILAAGLAGLALVTIILVQLGRGFLEPRRVQGIVNLEDEEVESETFQFGHFESITGSGFLSAPLYTQQGYPLGSISKSSQSSRNYLFYNPTSGAAHWLLPDNEGLVEWRSEFPPSRYKEEPEPVRGVLWQVIASDTNGDRKLTRNDLSVVFISGPSGRPLRELISGVQQLHGANQFSADRVSIMFLKDNRLRAAIVSLTDLSLVSNAEVSALPSRTE